MKVGIPTETKSDEHRVAITPSGVRELVAHRHEVIIERGAGVGSAISDAEFEAEGARIVARPEDLWAAADLVLKVKEPLAQEVAWLRPQSTLFTFLHLASDLGLTRSLCETGATCLAYETVEDGVGRLPLLEPMSELAGKIATQSGAFMLEKPVGGRGILLGGVPGVVAANVMIIGGGAVGQCAALVAIGMGADVSLHDISIDRLRELDLALNGRAKTIFASSLSIEERLPAADLVIGCVLIRGAKAPHVVTREQLQRMKPDAVLVDVAIDQGGCFETSRPTTHSDPTYTVDGIVHYCVANMPGAVPVTATYALTNATLPYVSVLADRGVGEAATRNPGLMRGINIAGGKVTHSGVAESLGLDYIPPERMLRHRRH